MPNQPPYQERQNQQGEEQSQNSEQRQSGSQTQGAFDVSAIAAPEEQSGSKKKSGPSVGIAKATAGRAGEKNLSIEITDVWVGNSRSARFTIKTAPGNPLEVVVQQLSYQKSYNGTGAINTHVLPVVPVGTKGKLMARDTTTGETLEKPWTWIPLGGVGGLNLWAFIKQLFWKPSS